MRGTSREVEEDQEGWENRGNSGEILKKKNVNGQRDRPIEGPGWKCLIQFYSIAILQIQARQSATRKRQEQRKDYMKKLYK